MGRCRDGLCPSIASGGSEEYLTYCPSSQAAKEPWPFIHSPCWKALLCSLSNHLLVAMPLPASHLSTGFSFQGDSLWESRGGLELAGLQSPAPRSGCPRGPLYPSLYPRSTSCLSCSASLQELTLGSLLGAVEPLCSAGSAPGCLSPGGTGDGCWDGG